MTDFIFSLIFPALLLARRDTEEIIELPISIANGRAAPYEVSPGVFNTQSAQCQSAITWFFFGFAPL